MPLRKKRSLLVFMKTDCGGRRDGGVWCLLCCVFNSRALENTRAFINWKTMLENRVMWQEFWCIGFAMTLCKSTSSLLVYLFSVSNGGDSKMLLPHENVMTQKSSCLSSGSHVLMFSPCLTPVTGFKMVTLGEGWGDRGRNLCCNWISKFPLKRIAITSVYQGTLWLSAICTE